METIKLLLLSALFAFALSACTTYPIAVSQITNCVNEVCDVELNSALRIPLKSGSDACLSFVVANTTRTFTVNVTTAEQTLVLDEYAHCGDVHLYHNTSCKCNNVPGSCLDSFDVTRFLDPLFPYNFRADAFGPSTGCPFPWLSGSTYCANISPMFDFRFDTYVVRDQTMNIALVASDGVSTAQRVWDSNGITTLNVGGIKAEVSLIGHTRDSLLVGKMIVIDTISNTKPKVLTTFNDVSGFNPDKFCYAKVANNAIAFDFDKLKSRTVVRPIDCYKQSSAVQLDAISHVNAFNAAQTLDAYTGYEWHVHFTENNAKNVIQDNAGLTSDRIVDEVRYYHHHTRRFGVKFVNTLTGLASDAFMEIGQTKFMMYPTANAETSFYSDTCVKLLFMNTDGTHVQGTIKRNPTSFSFLSGDSCTSAVYTGSYAGVTSPNFSTFYVVSQDGLKTTITVDTTGRLITADVPKDIVYRATHGSASALIAVRGKISGVKMISSSACLPAVLPCTVEGRTLSVGLTSTCGDANVYVSLNETIVASSGTYMTSKTPVQIRLNPLVDHDRHVELTACTSSACSTCNFVASVNYTTPVTTVSTFKSVMDALNNGSVFSGLGSLYIWFLVFVSYIGASWVMYEIVIYSTYLAGWFFRDVVLLFVVVPKVVKKILGWISYILWLSPIYWVFLRFMPWLFKRSFSAISLSKKRNKLKSQ